MIVIIHLAGLFLSHHVHKNVDKHFCAEFGPKFYTNLKLRCKYEVLNYIRLARYFFKFMRLLIDTPARREMITE